MAFQCLKLSVVSVNNVVTDYIHIELSQACKNSAFEQKDLIIEQVVQAFQHC